MSNLVANFLIDEWFKFMAYLGFVFLMFGLVVPLRIDNVFVILAGAALTFAGIAEMAFRPFQAAVKIDAMGRPQYSIEGRPRRITTAGIVLYTFASVLALGAIYRLFTVL